MFHILWEVGAERKVFEGLVGLNVIQWSIHQLKVTNAFVTSNFPILGDQESPSIRQFHVYRVHSCNKYLCFVLFLCVNFLLMSITSIIGWATLNSEYLVSLCRIRDTSIWNLLVGCAKIIIYSKGLEGSISMVWMILECQGRATFNPLTLNHIFQLTKHFKFLGL